MQNRRTLAVLFVASLLATVALVVVTRTTPPPREMRGSADTPAASSDSERARRDAGTRREPRAASVRTPEEEENLQQRLVLMLRHLYGDRISSVATQIQMAQIRIQVMSLFQADGAKRFEEILEEAFPGQKSAILATLAKVDGFDDWLARNEQELAAMSPEEREKAVLDRKRELFGEQAVEEMEAEARASEARDESMRETMRSLETSTGTSLDDKLETFTGALRKNYGDGPSAMALENGGTLAQAFFGLESVSRQLAELDPGARQEKINEIRRRFGYGDEQIAALEEQDREREASWQKGYAYMNERRALEGRLSGAELERQLAALRERYFGFEAPTIELEEKDGFFRFERPRLYGRN